MIFLIYINDYILKRQLKMKKILLCFVLLSSNLAFAGNSCFLIKKEGKVLKAEGDCDQRYYPCSTFKIPLALMGYDTGILENETSPQIEFKKGYVSFLESCKFPQTPATWMRNSCVWHSQV